VSCHTWWLVGSPLLYLYYDLYTCLHSSRYLHSPSLFVSFCFYIDTWFIYTMMLYKSSTWKNIVASTDELVLWTTKVVAQLYSRLHSVSFLKISLFYILRESPLFIFRSMYSSHWPRKHGDYMKWPPGSFLFFSLVKPPAWMLGIPSSFFCLSLS